MPAKLSTWSFLSLLVLWTGWFGAVPTAVAEEKIRVTVVAILATDQNTVVDPKLVCIAREIQKLAPHLTGFQLAQVTRKALEVDATAKFPLVDKEEAEILVKQGADKENRVSLKVKPPQMGEIVYTSTCGKFFPILTRYQTSTKDRLIIAIMVRPCHKH